MADGSSSSSSSSSSDSEEDADDDDDVDDDEEGSGSDSEDGDSSDGERADGSRGGAAAAAGAAGAGAEVGPSLENHTRGASATAAGVAASGAGGGGAARPRRRSGAGVVVDRVPELGPPAPRAVHCRCPCHAGWLTQVLVSAAEVEERRKKGSGRAQRPFRKQQVGALTCVFAFLRFCACAGAWCLRLRGQPPWAHSGTLR